MQTDHSNYKKDRQKKLAAHRIIVSDGKNQIPPLQIRSKNYFFQEVKRTKRCKIPFFVHKVRTIADLSTIYSMSAFLPNQFSRVPPTAPLFSLPDQLRKGSVAVRINATTLGMLRFDLLLGYTERCGGEGSRVAPHFKLRWWSCALCNLS
ncbi:hypothetical protein KIL84_000919 [Mauremys mutica]|uniref:Uncharacterized protein n=1 Tax=Mauremys mutica TaxID=74926 RepID=A0A9D4ATL5_9SAUR|nr:hypothetical protein KIL84_000919 [Mauremys mutica]